MKAPVEKIVDMDIGSDVAAVMRRYGLADELIWTLQMDIQHIVDQRICRALGR
jgi:hypothetical protein